MTKPTVSKALSDKAWIPPAPLHHVTVIRHATQWLRRVDWDSLDILNVKTMLTWTSNV